MGDASRIGVADIHKPDYGDAVTLLDGASSSFTT